MPACKRLFLFSLLQLLSMMVLAQQFTLFAGTYTGSGSKGIYVYRFNAATGRAQLLHQTDSAEHPSYLALSPNGKTLYACNETASAEGGRISAYAVDTNGRLRLLNQQFTGGNHPCYVAVHPSGKWVVVGNYSGGSVVAFPVNGDGSLQAYAQLIQHEGKGPNQQRQEKPHVHATVFSGDGNLLYVPDLGTDKLMLYRFDAKAAKPLQAAAQPFVASQPGSGPRHFTFHPNGKWAYLMEELSGTVQHYAVQQGRLVARQRISTHPDTATGVRSSADIHVSPDGRFLYASNRGNQNSLTIFRIAPATGRLSLVGFQSTGGQTPRNFCIDPSGKYLMVANQNSDAIVVFKRAMRTGLLQQTGELLRVPKPVCLKFGK